jgi:hypothetical protein
MDVPSDEEIADDGDSFGEVAGEVEIDLSEGSSSSSEDEVEAEAEAQRWRKHKTFAEVLPSARCESVAENYPDLLGKTEYEIWKLFLDQTIMEHILSQTLLYARRDCNNPTFEMTAQELQNFLGIILLSGYHSLPSEKDYWSTQSDLGVPIVATTMQRDR